MANFEKLSKLYRSKPAREKSGFIHRIDLSEAEADLPEGVRKVRDRALPTAVFDAAVSASEADLSTLWYQGHSRLWSAVSRYPLITRRNAKDDPVAEKPALYVAASPTAGARPERWDDLLKAGATVILTGIDTDTPGPVLDWLKGHGISLGDAIRYGPAEDPTAMKKAEHLPSPKDIQRHRFDGPAILFEQVEKLYFQGHELRATGAQALVRFDGRPVMVIKRVGEGRLVVAAPADLLANKWSAFGHKLWDHAGRKTWIKLKLGQGARSSTWLQPDNNHLIDNLSRLLLGDAP